MSTLICPPLLMYVQQGSAICSDLSMGTWVMCFNLLRRDGVLRPTSWSQCGHGELTHGPRQEEERRARYRIDTVSRPCRRLSRAFSFTCCSSHSPWKTIKCENPNGEKYHGKRNSRRPHPQQKKPKKTLPSTICISAQTQNPKLLETHPKMAVRTGAPTCVRLTPAEPDLLPQSAPP